MLTEIGQSPDYLDKNNSKYVFPCYLKVTVIKVVEANYYISMKVLAN